MRTVEIINALNQPLQKLIDAVSGAIGKVYEPRHMRKTADAEAYRINTISEAMRNNCDLPITYNSQDATTLIDISDFNKLVDRTGARIAFQEIKKQQNIEIIIDKAYEELEYETEVSKEPVSEDWMIRFFNSVEDICDEKIQEIFAKILADEIKHPNSCSLRTLNVLRNLSKSEAELFIKILPLILHGVFFSDKDLLEKYGINYNDILKLDDCGLISSQYVQRRLTLNNRFLLVTSNEYVIVSASDEESKEYMVKIQAHVLTSAGKEISNVINCNKSKEQMYDIARLLKKENESITISLHKIDKIDDNGISYDDVDLLCECDSI